MPIVLGNTTITGLGVGGLPAGTVNATTLADAAVTRAKMGYAGAVLQVVQTTKTNSFSTTTNNSWVDITGLSDSITPSNASNKILVMGQISVGGTWWNSSGSPVRVLRGTTSIFPTTVSSGSAYLTGATVSHCSFSNSVANTEGHIAVVSIIYLDSPNTTSATTYKFQTNSNGTTNFINQAFNGFGVGTSSITLMEIAG